MCESLGMSDRQGGGGRRCWGDAAEHRMTDVQMCICGAFFAGKKGGGGGGGGSAH